MAADPRKWSPRGGIVGESVWVLSYGHKHGTDVGVYSTSEKALQAARDIIRQYLGDLQEDDIEAIEGLLNADKIRVAMQVYEDATTRGLREGEWFHLVERNIE